MGVTAAIAAIAVVGTTAGIGINSSEKAARETSRARDQATQRAGALPKPDDPANQTAAAKASDRRRALYANVGRSSTILTNPTGLGSAPSADGNEPPKALLGL